MDSKSIGLCPQGFESPRCRFISFLLLMSYALLKRCNYRDLPHTLPATKSPIAQHAHWERELLDNVELAIQGSIGKSVGLKHAPDDIPIPAVVENACVLDNLFTHVVHRGVGMPT
jgi:hypothetical protein